MKQWICLILLLSALLICACDTNMPDECAGVTEHVLPEIALSEPAEYEGSAFRMVVMLPEGWAYDKVVGDRGVSGERLYGLRIYPLLDPMASALFTYEQIDCTPPPTPAELSATTQNSGAVTVQSWETEDGNPATLITYTALPGAYYMQYTLTPTQEALYGDAMLAIANGASMADGLIREEDARKLASEGRNVSDQAASVDYDPEKGQWHVRFRHSDGSAFLHVILNKEGKQLSVRYIDSFG